MVAVATGDAAAPARHGPERGEGCWPLGEPLSVWAGGEERSPGRPPHGRAPRPSRPSDVRPSWARGASPGQGSAGDTRWRREGW